MSDIVAPLGIVPLWDMVGGPMPRGILGLGDPDVHVIDGTPTMLLGGFSSSFRNRLYIATLAPEADPASASWSLDLDGHGRARALAHDPPKGAWDAAGMHTPSFVPAVGDQPARIYYTGRVAETVRAWQQLRDWRVGTYRRRVAAARRSNHSGSRAALECARTAGRA